MKTPPALVLRHTHRVPLRPRWVALALVLITSALPLCAQSFVASGTLPAKEASQAAAADEHFVYAIGSKVVAKYDRATGQRLAVSKDVGPPAHHLNSGAWWEGRLVCAHSNYPAKPSQSEARVLDPATMELSVLHDFGPGHGSLTWVVREGDAWWCNFAAYGEGENAKTTLVKYDGEWKELGSWTYPPAVIARLGKMSISGGLWWRGDLLAIGHDRPEIYRLRLPKNGESVLELIETMPAPFPGQGIAVDPKTGGLVGIGRAAGEVIFGSAAK